MIHIPWGIWFMVSSLCKSLGSVKICWTGSQYPKVERSIPARVMNSTGFITNSSDRLQGIQLITCATSVLYWDK